MAPTVSRGSTRSLDNGVASETCGGVDMSATHINHGLVDGLVDGLVGASSLSHILGHITGWIERRMTAVVVALIASMSTLMIVLQRRHHANFETFGYDAGLYDQTLWLLAHEPFASPFLTSRGLPLWGHHVNPILLVLAPLTRLGAGVLFFAALQTVAVLAGALPVGWLTRAKTGSAWAGLAMAAAYLVYPANLFFSWTFFHPELLAVLPMLLMGWFAHQRRFAWLWLSAVVAMACREEIAVAVAGFALVAGFGAMRRRDRERFAHAICLAVVATAWFVVASKVIIPAALGGEPFYINTFYGKYGNSYGSIASNLLADPSLAAGLVTDGDRETFLLDLFGPLAMLPLLGSPIVMIAVPLVGLLMSSNDLAHNIQSHYPAVLVAGVFLSTIEVLRTAWNRRIGRHLLILILTCSSIASVVRSPAPWSLRSGVWKTAEPKRASLEQAVAMIPDDASVTAIGHVVPRLSHRRVVYQFPNPLERWFYGEFAIEDPAGVRLDAPPAMYPDDVDWILVDREALGRYRGVLDRVINDGTFEVLFDSQDIVVARRSGMSS